MKFFLRICKGRHPQKKNLISISLFLLSKVYLAIISTSTTIPPPWSWQVDYYNALWGLHQQFRRFAQLMKNLGENKHQQWNTNTNTNTNTNKTTNKDIDTKTNTIDKNMGGEQAARVKGFGATLRQGVTTCGSATQSKTSKTSMRIIRDFRDIV